MTILHFSDLHLDMPFASSQMPSEVARGCRLRLRQTLQALMDLAVEHRVDAVTIAGDLFEGDRVTADTIAFLDDSFARLAPIPVIIAPGNHDYFNQLSPYCRHEWPENVLIFSAPRLQSIQLPGQVVIWGMAHTIPVVKENPLQGFRVPDDGKRHLLLLHGAETGNPDEDRASYAPFRSEDLEAAGFAFALLGHFHKFRLLQGKNLLGVYPGSPQPLSFGEAGKHGAVLVKIKAEADEVHCESLDTVTQAFTRLELDAAPYSNTVALAEAVISAIPHKAPKANFLRLKLRGLQPPGSEIDLELLEQHLADFFDFIIIQDERRSRSDAERIATEPTLRGNFAKTLLKMLDEEPEDKGLIRLALDLGLKAFSGEKLV